MKRKILLSESELIRLIKRIISESVDVGSQYKISAEGGNVVVHNTTTNVKQKYSMSMSGVGGLSVENIFYEKGTPKITAGKKVLGVLVKSETQPLNIDKLKNVIPLNWKNTSFKITSDKDPSKEFTFTKVS